MKINIIAAIGQNNEIGLNNKLLWTSKSDLAHFKQLTLDKPIIMGRKTFESLPGILPGRPHMVVSHNSINQPDHPSVFVLESLDFALEYCRVNLDMDEVFIIGGASIYEQALPLADELHISHMNWTGEADTYFPTIGDEWSASVPGIIHFDYPDWTYTKYTRKELVSSI